MSHKDKRADNGKSLVGQGATKYQKRMQSKTFRLSPAEQAQILAMRLAGKSQRSIAKETHHHRTTVIRVLNAFEADQQVQLSKSILLESLPIYTHRLSAIAIQGDRQALTDILKGLHVLTPRREHVETSDLDPFPGKDYYELRFYGIYLRWPTPEEKEKFIKANPDLIKRRGPPVLLAKNESPGDD